MNISKQQITPEKASKLLEGNVSNRPLSKNHVSFLAEQIKNDTWQVTGDPIKISAAGRIIDGQHRLSAIVKAGIPVEIFVAQDVPDEVFTVLDTGKQRTARDVLSIRSLKNPNEQAAVARAYMEYRDKSMKIKNRSYSNHGVLEFCTEHDVLSHVNTAKIYVKKGAPLSATIIALCSFIFSEIDPGQSAIFIESLCLGLNIRPNTPLYLLREKINKAIMGNYSLNRWEVIAVTIKAWNLERTEGKLPSMLIYNPQREEFPKAI